MMLERRKAILSLSGLAFLFLRAASAAEVGKTSIESYHVNATIESRFARTDIVANFRNELDCSALRGFTMQLPLNARVRSLSMTMSDGCVISSTVKSEHEAKESFEAQVEEGTPAAILTAWDSSNYRVDVSIPKSGKTRLEVHYEERLIRKQHELAFQLPVSPGVDVERLEVNVFVSEPQTGVSKFSLDDPGYGSFEIKRDAFKASGHLELSNVPSNSLPRLLRAAYDTESFSEESGVLVADGNGCATLFFNPATFLPSGLMPRFIVFVIDVSGSMGGQKLKDAKIAFSTMITTLTEADYFAIHSFSNSGTESVFNSRAATTDAKSDAVGFVNNLESGGGTNLNGAYINGLDRIMEMQQAKNQELEFVSVLVILTDGEATSGITNSQEISKRVRTKNEINAKIFALAFGFGADLPLLSGICVQNGGVAIPVYEGFGDAAQQMEDIFLGQLGGILASDIVVGFGGDFGIQQQTQSNFPVLASGSEIVARVMMAEGDYSQGILEATTKAMTVTGETAWTATLDMETVTPALDSECSVALALTRIDAIMQFREGALALGNDMNGYEPYALTGQTDSSADKAEEARLEALKIALDAAVVWPGLTAMVTKEGSQCAADTATCTDGDISDVGENYGAEEEADIGSAPRAPGSSADVSSTTNGAGASGGGVMADMGMPTPGRTRSSGGGRFFLNVFALAAALTVTVVLVKK